jgi:5-methyltetrahydrofolate--homocysteine methyltransferase
VNLKELSQAIIVGNHNKSVELTQQAISEGLPPSDIINDGLISGMDEVGRLFNAGEYFLPDLMVAARAMHLSMGKIKPLLVRDNAALKGRVVVGTVKGDLHDVGKNLVCMMLEGAGFDVVDLGIDVSPEKFVAAVRENKTAILAMSALLSTTMASMKKTIEALTDSGLRDNVKIMIGGAPVTQRFADDIGADGYARDATSAVDKARKLVA